MIVLNYICHGEMSRMLGREEATRDKLWGVSPKQHYTNIRITHF